MDYTTEKRDYAADEQAFAELKAMGKPKRRNLKAGETVQVPGYEFLGITISGKNLEVLEYENGEICPIIPNPEGLAKAVFSLVVINQKHAFTDRHLRYVRRHLGMTQEHLADAIGVRRQTVVEYEKPGGAFDKAVEMTVRFLALPRALNYLPDETRAKLNKPLQAIQDLYTQLDELSIPLIEAVRNGGKKGGTKQKGFVVSIDHEEAPMCGV